MSLQYRVEEVPEGLESYYKETAEGFVLDVEGVAPQSELEAIKTEAEESKKKVKEFRQHNIALRKQVEASSKIETKDGDSGEPPNIENLIEDAVSEMKNKLSETADERNILRSQLEEVVLSDKVKDIAVKHGVFESALPDIVTRAKAVFTVKDGKPVPMKESRDENGELLSPESWMKKLEEDAPHLFKPSTGSGAHRPVSGMRSPKGEERSSAQKIADGISKRRHNATKNVM